jgi:uncharacterized protein DUF2017
VPRAFRRVGQGRVRAVLSRDEMDLLRGLPEQLRTVLDEAEADPANERLFPPAYLNTGDADAEAEYRRLMHSELVAARLGAIELVTASLQRATRRGQRWSVELSEDEALAWLGVLNDVRLTLGVRLEVTEDLDGEIDPADPRAPGFRLLYYLGWLEEHLVAALSA